MYSTTMGMLRVDCDERGKQKSKAICHLRSVHSLTTTHSIWSHVQDVAVELHSNYVPPRELNRPLLLNDDARFLFNDFVLFHFKSLFSVGDSHYISRWNLIFTK